MENKKEMKKNNNNVLVIIIVVLAFLVGALGTYVVMDRLNSEDVPVLDGGDENEQDEDDKNGEVSIPTNPDEVAGTGSINTVDYVYGDFSENPTSLGITPVLVDSKTVEFSVNASIFERLRSSMVNVQGGTYGTTNYKFYYKSTEDIYSAFIGGFGQAVAGNEYIFLLMSDGTLQYKAIFNKNIDSKGNKYFTTDIREEGYLSGFNTLSGVNKGVKLVNASKTLPQHTGHGTMLLYVDQDSFYDLEPYFVK